MKNVLIISYYWPPSGGPGVQRWLKMVKFLKLHDICPIVLTVSPSSATYPIIDNSLSEEVPADLKVYRTNSFEPLKIFAKLFGSEKIPYSGFANVETKSFFSKITRWIRGNFFIPDARKGWNKYAIYMANKLIVEKEIACIITSGPPHSTHLIGIKLKEVHGVEWIADFRDPWTDIYYYDQLLLSKRSRLKNSVYEKEVLNKADKVLAVCESNARLLKSKMNDKSKLSIIPNGYDKSDFPTIQKTKNEVFRIGYIGTLAELYDPTPILKVLLNLNFPIKLIIAGKISPQIENFINNTDLSELTDYLGYLDHQEALKVTRECDLLLHILPVAKGTNMGTSGKLFEYLGSEVPILNIGPEMSDSAMIIEECGAGKTFNRENIKEIKQFVNAVFEGEFESSGNIIMYSRRELTRKLASIIRHDK